MPPISKIAYGLVALSLVGCGGYDKMRGIKSASTNPAPDAQAPNSQAPATQATTAAAATQISATPAASPPSTGSGSAAATAATSTTYDLRDLVGKHFRTACTGFTATDPLDQSLAVVYELSFTKDYNVISTATTYSDTACTAAQLVYRATQRVSLISTEGSMDTYLVEASATPKTDAVALSWSSHQRDGYGNWETGIQLPVYDSFLGLTNISAVFGRSSVMLHQIYAIDSAHNFYWGQLTTALDGTTESQRPTAVDKSLAFVPQS